MNETDNICGGCGATAADRQQNLPNEPQAVRECPHCCADKCCMCDMGDDVQCGNCADED